MRNIRTRRNIDRVSKVEIVKGKIEVSDCPKCEKREKKDLLELTGTLFFDFSKLLFIGIFIDRFFNSSEITEGLGAAHLGGIIIVMILLGFALVHISSIRKGEVL